MNVARLGRTPHSQSIKSSSTPRLPKFCFSIHSVFYIWELRYQRLASEDL